MAYTEKYFITYCDKFGHNYRVSILQNEYVGDTTELEADVNPMIVDYESSEDFKFSPIRPSVGSVNMVFGTDNGVDFEEFWSADEREFKVEQYYDGSIKWVGFVIPNGFSYQLKGGLYHANIQAADGLSTLEAFQFRDDNGFPYGNQDLVYNNEFEFPFILIFTEILRKLDLGLDLWACVDSYEKTMTKTGDTRDADPLANAYVNVRTYINKTETREKPYWSRAGEEWNCYEVIENCLYIFGAKLYQENGTWRIKTINTDANYGTGVTQLYWRKYNTLAVYLPNYEIVNDTRDIPCDSSDAYILSDDSVMRMDEVYKAFRMNYEYTFLREGDDPLSLLKNGNFYDFNNTSALAAPAFWERYTNYSDSLGMMRMREDVAPFDEIGFDKCLELWTQKTGISTAGTFYGNTPDKSLLFSEQPSIIRGDLFTLNIWHKYRGKADMANFNNGGAVYFKPLLKLILKGENGGWWCLMNKTDSYNEAIWLKYEPNDFNNDFNHAFYDAKTLVINPSASVDWDSDTNTANTELRKFRWYNNILDIPEAPASGTLFIHHQGVGVNQNVGWVEYDNLIYHYYNTNFLTETIYGINTGMIDTSGNFIEDPRVAGFELGYISDEDKLSPLNDYIYENSNTKYTLEPDPITVFNGDVQDVNHISNIIVPTNVSGGKNFWNTLNEDYANSSIGLVTVKDVMRQYAKPKRIFEASIFIENPSLGAVYTFDAIPNVRFILQRGSINSAKQYIEDATFFEISNDVLPDGGREGFVGTLPLFQYTGNSWCETVNGENTGYLLEELININVASETYGELKQERSLNTVDACPLLQPIQYLWSSDDVSLNTAALDVRNINQIDNKNVTVTFTNEDNNYLYFIHLKSLGVVEVVNTNTSPSNVVSDWIYLSDITLNGYLYRVFRTDYTMSDFSGFLHNFKFS
jgi:hypothetical protein